VRSYDGVCLLVCYDESMRANDPLADHFRLNTSHQKALAGLGLITVEDLLYHLPTRYETISNTQSVGKLIVGQEAIVYGQLSGLSTRTAWKSKRPIAEGYVEDGSGKIKIIWFNQPYLAKMYNDGAFVKVSGRVAGSASKPYLANPKMEPLKNLPIKRHDNIFKATPGDVNEAFYPVYRETKGLTSKWLYHAVLKCFARQVLTVLSDPLPVALLKRYHLPDLATALVWAHTPKKAEHATSARKRFAFEEVFYIQVKNAQNRAAVNAASTYVIKTTAKEVASFTSRFPFTLTNRQNQTIAEIVADFSGDSAMSRLLEGDVGSGKTAVAATTAFVVANSRPRSKEVVGNGLTDVAFGNLQVAYMAPTEILAKQHFASFVEYFHHLPIAIGLITGAGCMKFPSKTDPSKATKISKAQLLRWVKNGEIPILIGTHALMQKSVTFKHLAYVIIDEQQRFGTNQRKQLVKKDTRLPHLLSMTATPIPRTLALTMYGDLDITLLDEMPPGRRPVITKVVGLEETTAMYEHVRDELARGRQAYVICPRIDEPDPTKATALTVKSVTAEAKRLGKTEFQNYKLGLLHGKLTPAEKDRVMNDFKDRAFDILVTTSVVEVGVNVPNATNIIIEDAERFGLAQLHQLRGRVLRGTHQPYCFVVTKSQSGKTKERLRSLVTAPNGFALAEYDLRFRGGGELYGGKQSGLSDLGMEALRNLKLVEAARHEAQTLVKSHPNKEQLARAHPLISRQVDRLNVALHLE